jgi:hypothetical protein
MSSPGYLKLVEIENKLNSALILDEKDVAIQLICGALSLIENESETVGKALQYSVFLNFAHQLDQRVYDDLKKRFILSAESGHGWKLLRMFKNLRNRAELWSDSELKDFCIERISELKKYKDS